ncbi:MAG: hypothetical protein WB036_17485 [Pseudolabrys sp.]
MDSVPMRSGSVTTKRRRGNFSTAEAVRAMIASAALAGILLLAFFVTTGPYFAADRQAQNAVPKIAPLSPSNGGESAHRVASIVVETDKKGRCEERRFDNRSGKIIAATVVDCEARLADERDASPSENLSAERMRAILGAFRR